MKTGLKLQGLVLGSVIAATATAAQAGTLPADLTFDGVRGFGGFKVYYGGERIARVSAGRMSYIADETTGYFDADNTVYTFCTELDQSIRSGDTHTYDFYGANEDEAITALPDGGGLSDGIAMDFRAAAMSALFIAHFDQATTGSRVEAAAMQLAVWEIAYELVDGQTNDTDFDVYDGRFCYGFGGNSDRNAAGELANVWLSNLAIGGISDQMLGLGNPLYQDQLTLIAIPLPAAVGLGLVGLGMAGVARRRRRLNG